ncbi:hypothetical protein SAMN04488057_12164 [Cyclobacterium lianum]|uniref:Uncharacterized protein n=1 Tax=Cyclobacterium lianum TaxID=388280 RepID=A0A1M7QPT5_9BACT|nr:hypothetical protein [Cyclobacterium lianum]SHN33449.1 hypothetical protein SAMN04488057_12164 [Cyclobacterium lianum]
MRFQIKKITLNIEGKEVVAIPVSDEELNKVKIHLEKSYKDKECTCGDQWCSPDGFWWVCSLGRENNCIWFKTDWRCNP